MQKNDAQMVNVHEAKTHFSKLLARVKRGEVIKIASNGEPIALLSPIKIKKVKRTRGTAKGLVTIHETFFDDLPQDLLKEFYGK